MLKGHASFAAAIAVTAISLPVNLPGIAGQGFGGVNFIISAMVVIAWALVALFCGFSRGRLAAAAIVVAIMLAGAAAMWVNPQLTPQSVLGLAVMLAASPLGGFGAVTREAAQTAMLCTASCVLLFVMLATSPWRLRKKLADISVFGSDMQKPSSLPEFPDKSEFQAHI